MLKLAEYKQTDLCQISLTGTRAIVLLGLLIEAPRTFDEIKNIFINLGIMEEENSNDIIRININTLRAIGCEITKATSKNDFKYSLISHPFTINITEDEINLLKKVYKNIKFKSDIKTLLQLDSIFNKIANHAYNKETKEQIYGISIFKDYDLTTIKKLINAFNNKEQIDLLYYNPIDKNISEKSILVKKIVLENEKLYIHAVNLIDKEPVILFIKRIKKILSCSKFYDDNINIKTINVKFILKNFGVAGILENEKIIENSENGYIIEGIYYNEFLAIQRLMSFGSDCTVLEPNEIKQQIINKYKNMREKYNG